MRRVLVVDDEESIVTLLKYNLEKEGYEVDTCANGRLAFERALKNDYQFLLLDVMLPDMDGMEITRKLRREKIDTPILILTAKDDPVEKIIGLEIGADDYLTKPFSPRELIARMKAISRREELSASKKEASQRLALGDDQQTIPIQIGDILVDEGAYEVSISGRLIELTPKEFEILLYFMKRKGRIISRDMLLERMWAFDFDGPTRIVDVHISHLREKIEKDPKKPKYLVTVRGFGYRFEDPTEGTMI